MNRIVNCLGICMVLAGFGCLFAMAAYTAADKEYKDYVATTCTIESFDSLTSRSLDSDNCEAHTIVSYPLDSAPNGTCSDQYLLAPRFMKASGSQKNEFSSCEWSNSTTAPCMAPTDACVKPLEGDTNKPFCSTDTARNRPRNCDDLLTAFVILFIIGSFIVFTLNYSRVLNFFLCPCIRDRQRQINPWSGCGICGVYRFTVEDFTNLEGCYKLTSNGDGVRVQITGENEGTVYNGLSREADSLELYDGIIEMHTPVNIFRLIFTGTPDELVWADQNSARVVWKRTDEELPEPKKNPPTYENVADGSFMKPKQRVPTAPELGVVEMNNTGYI